MRQRAYSVLVIIPTYNECENIALLLPAILTLKIDLAILIIDDHSPDGTAHCVEKLQCHYSHRLYLLRRPRKEGLGQAYLAGFAWALSYHYDYICTMDADCSHAPTTLPHLISACKNNHTDIAIGSRYIAGGCIRDWPYSRVLLSRIANWIARSITGIAVQDVTAGFVCYKRSILEAILSKPIISNGYSFQVEMKFLAYLCGARLQELPIIFVNRIRGKSKMNLKIAASSFWHLLQMRWYNRKRY